MTERGYMAIYEELRRRISAGEWKPDSPLPSEHQLGLAFAVSRPTIRRALEKLVAAKQLYRRPGIGTFVAMPTIKKKSPVIGIGFSIITNPFYTQLLLEGAATACAEHGAQLRILTHEDLSGMVPREVDGIVAVSVLESEFPKLAELNRNGTPVVLINRQPENCPVWENLSTMSVDYTAESKRLIVHALKAGYRRIAVIGGENSSRVYGLRCAGWREAYRECGVAVDEALVLGTEIAYDNINGVADFLRRSRPDLLFVTGADFVNPLLIALIAAKMRVPDDIKLLCFDDLGALNSRQALPIGYVQMPLQLMGASAVSQLLLTAPNSAPVHRNFAANYVFTSGQGLLL